jgi:hypothetical protein
MANIRAEWIEAIKEEMKALDTIDWGVNEYIGKTLWHGYAFGSEWIIELKKYINTDKPKLYFGKGFCANKEMDFNINTRFIYYAMVNLPQAIDEIVRYKRG